MTEKIRKINPENLRVGLVTAYAIDGLEGGVKEHISRFKNFLKSQGHQAVIIAPSNPQSEQTSPGAIYLGRAAPHSFRGTVAYTSWTPINPSTILALNREYPVDVFHYHEPEVSITSLEHLLFSDVINFVTFHLYQDPNWKFMAFRLLGLIYGHKIDGRIAVSAATRDLAMRYFPGDYRIIPNGIDTKRFSPDNPKIEKFADGKVNILFVGRLEERKGVDYMLSAFAILRAQNEGVRLIIVGGGQSEKYKDRVKREGIQDVHFEGRVSDEELPSYYATADILTSPATHGESFGIVNLEGMATGLPLVAGDNAGYRTLVTKDEGFLVNPKNILEYSNILGLLASNAELRKRLGNAGLVKAKMYDWSSVGQMVLDYYLEVIREKEEKQHLLAK